MTGECALLAVNDDGERRGMERLARKDEAGSVVVGKRICNETQEKGLVKAVNLVANDRVPERKEGAADLVCASGFRMRKDAADTAIERIELEVGLGIFGSVVRRLGRFCKFPFFDDDGLFVVREPTLCRKVLRENAVDEDGIFLFDRMALELPCEGFRCFSGFRDEDNSGGFAVEPVDDEWLPDAGVAEQVEQGVLAIAAAGVAGKIAGLVYDRQIPVLKNQTHIFIDFRFHNGAVKCSEFFENMQLAYKFFGTAAVKKH